MIEGDPIQIGLGRIRNRSAWAVSPPRPKVRSWDELEDSATGCGPPALRTPWLPCLAIDQVELRYMILYYMHLYEPIYTRSQVTRDWVAERICRGALSE